MCEYTGEVNDPQRFNQTPLTDKDLNAIVKSLLGEPQEVCNKTGLSPFYALNPAPEVNLYFNLHSFPLDFALHTPHLTFLQMYLYM